MKNPKNLFKARLQEKGCQLGVWNTIGGNTVPEALGSIGYDWICVDCEHGAIETIDVLPALQAIASAGDTPAMVRSAANDPVLIKRILDMGAQTILVPYIETAEEAQQAVAAMHYGPKGIRGMAGMTRATRYGHVENYFETASEELCLIAQVESLKGIENLEAIAKTDGVDAVFFGPADLSATMGLPGQMNHPQVLEALEDSITRLQELDVPIGIMALDHTIAENYMELGVDFVAISVDAVTMVQKLSKDLECLR